MQTKSISHLQYTDKESSSAILHTSHSSKADAPVGVDLREDETPFLRIPPSRVAEQKPATGDQDSLTAAWVAHVRREEGALPEQLYRPRREAPVPSAAAEEVAALEVVRNSEEEAGPQLLPDRSDSFIAHLWKTRRGDFYLVFALILLTTLIQWVIWSK